MRFYKKSKDDMLPRSIFCEYTYGRYRDDGVRSLERNLPFLNASTGLRNRMITRDPITGLGELPAEWNPLKEGHIQRKVLPQRNLIRMEGDLGPEYNCLYTTKELKCKPRDGRDPIRLEGDLGIELDPFYPNGTGLTRRRSERAPRRNPILGTGDFSSEPEPLSNTNGRARSRFISQVRTDPITHSIPERESASRRSMRQFNERWVMRDPIRHRYGDEYIQTNNRTHEMKHFSQPKTGNEWLHNSAKDVSSKTLPTRRPYVHRNPITGEGMRPEDYSDLLRIPSQYYFRNNPTVTHLAPASKSVVKPSAPAPRQTRSAVSPPNRSFTRASNSPVKSVDATNKEPPVVKKVIRPKRPSTTERTRVADSGIFNAGDTAQTAEQTNGFTVNPKTNSVRKPSNRVNQPKEMSFFEEAQLAYENTLDESKQSNDHVYPDPEPTESVDYSESVQSFGNGAFNEPNQRTERAKYTNVHPDNAAEPTEPHRSFTPNLDRAASGNLFEELQAHEREAQLCEEPLQREYNSQQQETTAPLFISTAEEDGDDIPQNANSGEIDESLRAQEKNQSVRHDEADGLSGNEVADDYISAFLKSDPEARQPVGDIIHEPNSKQFESLALHDEPQVIQTPGDSLE